ncbi:MULTISPECIES: acetylglutamate kinase [unclassified Rickettsia]|uniref:amino acid kinase family protein n=1 Tax=unclassified Rickettsia TaxID=114295 RepID=UPI00209F8EDC|nr:acetylglutamate kinase [Rickettsia endosymbiont of Ceutorhynchus assimilis]
MQENLKLVWQNASNRKKKETENIPSLKNIITIKDIIRRGNEIKDQVIVVKLSSTIINNNELLTAFAESIQLLEMCGAKISIIHDHIDLENSPLKTLVEDNLNDRIGAMAHNNPIIMEMILSGYVNKLIVSKLCSVGCYAIGISGKDTNLLQAKKSKLSHRRTTNQDVIDIGFISEPIMINPEILLNFEDNNIIPVISPIANDEQENTHLLNADLTTAVISSALSADHLILPYESSKSLAPDIKAQDVNVFKSMLNDNNNFIKAELIEIAVNAIENNIGCVHFISNTTPNSVLLTMFTKYK